jgi:uncharacterized membrane protein (DUF373 family)
MTPSRNITDESIRVASRTILPYVRLVVCVLIGLASLALIIGMALQVADIFIDLINNDRSSLLQHVAIVLVMLKALRILVSYLATHHVRLYHIVEIAVIASVVEIVFASQTHSLAMNILLACFAVANLLILVLFYPTMMRMNTDQTMTGDHGAAV